MGDMVALLVHTEYRQYVQWKLQLGGLIAICDYCGRTSYHYCKGQCASTPKDYKFFDRFPPCLIRCPQNLFRCIWQVMEGMTPIKCVVWFGAISQASGHER